MLNLELTHPALSQLLRMQGVAKLRRAGNGFRSPRRFVFSLVALILTLFWFGNAVVAVLFREATDPAAFQGMIAGSLTLYLGWHLLRAAFARPDAGVLWNDVERQLLCGGPFTASQLLRFRFSSIATAAAVKSILVAGLMSPDIHLWIPAAGGLFAALMLLDLLRMIVEIFSSGCHHRTYIFFRTVVLSVVAAVGIRVMAVALAQHVPGRDLSLPIGMRMAIYAYQELSLLRESMLGTIATIGFRPFVQMISAQCYSPGLLGWTILASAMLVGTGLAVLKMDEYYRQLRRWQEETDYQVTRQRRRISDTATPLEVTFDKSGGLTNGIESQIQGIAGPIAWRQWLCVKKYSFSLMVALAPQLAMALLPILGDFPPVPMLLNVAGTLAFFTLVLMPSALKLDFRRDLTLLPVYKSMPLTAASVVAGQLAVPIMVCTVFQACVLLVPVAMSGVPIGYATLALTMLLPVSVFVFAMENAIFLMYPHKPHEEGIEMFLRAILTFTMKGILFGLALFVIIAWASVAAWIATHCGPAWTVTVVYTTGLCVLLAAASTMSVYGLVRVYERFDLTEDVPA